MWSQGTASATTRSQGSHSLTPSASWSRSRCMEIVSDQRMGPQGSGAVPHQTYSEYLTSTIPMGRCQLVVHHTLVSVSVGRPLPRAPGEGQLLRPFPRALQQSSRRLMPTYRRYHRTIDSPHTRE